MFSRSSLKTCNNFHTRLLIPFLSIYVDMILKPMYIGMCAKGQIVLEFSLMWIWVTCLLAFHMPWDRLNLTFHYPIEELYKEPFGYIKGRGIEEQENYSPLFPELILESTYLCPLEHFVFFPSFLFSCELAIERWRIEVVEAQVGDLVSPICRRANKDCLYCNLCLILIEISFSCPIMCIWMSIWSMDAFKCLYVIDYIC